ncbi:nucleotidyltransferase family protein, partial [Vibrio mimicus]
MIDKLNNENVTWFLSCLDANYIRNSNLSKSQVDDLLSISRDQFMFLLYFKNLRDCVPHLLEDVYIKKNLEYENRINKKIIYGRRVIEALNKSGRPCYLIKGISNSKYIFDSIYHRDFSDLDLIVRPEDFYYANRTLLGMGAKSNLGENFVDFESIQTHEVRYEVEPNIYIEIKVCPSCILDLDIIEHMCQTSITKKIANFDYLTFDLENSFILLCANLYSNYTSEFGKVKIRDVIDTYLFMSAQIMNIDLDLFYSRLAKYGLEEIVLSAIAFVDLFFYKLKSSFLLKFIKSSSDVQWYKKVTMEYFGAVDNDSFISVVLRMSNSQGHFLLQHYKNEFKKSYLNPEISREDGKYNTTKRIRSHYFNIDISFHFIT